MTCLVTAAANLVFYYSETPQLVTLEIGIPLLLRTLVTVFCPNYIHVQTSTKLPLK